MVHHILLAGAEVARAACCGIVLGEGGGVPLLEAAFGFGAVEAEEEDVFVCYFGREVLGVLKFSREIWERVTDPAWTWLVVSLGMVVWSR